MKKYHFVLLLISAAVIPPLCHAAEIFSATPDPAVAAKDPDFALQGEYLASVEEGKIGIQVIALGEGEFEAVLSNGGLPGEGWDGEKPRESAKSKRSED